MNNQSHLTFEPEEYTQTVTKKVFDEQNKSYFLGDNTLQVKKTKTITIDECRIPFEELRVHGLFSLNFFSEAIQNFGNLKILKIFGVIFPTEEYANQLIKVFVKLSERLEILKLKNITQRKRQRLGQSKDSSNVEVEPCNWEPLLTALLTNKSLKKLSLISLDLGRSIELRQMISDLPLYNEWMTSLNIQFNKMCKIKPLIQNIVRNRNSMLSRLIVSGNQYNLHDLKEMLTLLDTNDTIFGDRQHFKLRYIDISNNEGMQDFQFKLKKQLDEFYGVQQTRISADGKLQIGDKVTPIFRKVYIQYKTRDIGQSNPINDSTESVFKSSNNFMQKQY